MRMAISDVMEGFLSVNGVSSRLMSVVSSSGVSVASESGNNGAGGGGNGSLGGVFVHLSI